MAGLPEVQLVDAVRLAVRRELDACFGGLVENHTDHEQAEATLHEAAGHVTAKVFEAMVEAGYRSVTKRDAADLAESAEWVGRMDAVEPG